MASAAVPLPAHHQALVDRFAAACAADARVLAAFLGGSHAHGRADAFSDLDLYLITADVAFAEFWAERERFLRQLGELLFLEDFGLDDTVFFIYADGAEGEVGISRASACAQLHHGPFRVLLDKHGLLDGAVFAGRRPEPGEQRETLRRLIFWFWHDLSHFITALGRGQLWWAYGQLGVLRQMCVNLARLQQDFSAPVEDYDKVDQALPAEQLRPLEATLCPLEPQAMQRAALALLDYYRALAPSLAQAHGLVYPAALERVFADRLKALAG
jgi:predicted nucleotidyltransferase